MRQSYNFLVANGGFSKAGGLKMVGLLPIWLILDDLGFPILRNHQMVIDTGLLYFIASYGRDG